MKALMQSRKADRVRTWHVGADCSKYGQQQQGRPDRRRWTTDIQRQWGIRSKASPDFKVGCVLELIGEIRRCCPVHTLSTQEQQAWTGSSPVLPASAVGGGAEWYGRTSTKRTRVAPPSSWLTGAAGEGTMECQPGLHYRSPVVTGRVTTSATGELSPLVQPSPSSSENRNSASNYSPSRPKSSDNSHEHKSDFYLVISNFLFLFYHIFFTFLWLCNVWTVRTV